MTSHAPALISGTRHDVARPVHEATVPSMIPDSNADDFATIEQRWVKAWRDLDLFTADDSTSRPRKYLVTMFPYPSGDLHMGHAAVLAIHDVAARYWRMRGHEVLNPMGWDSFGMPAENAAIANGTHPARYTEENIATQARSLERYGLAIDWTRRLHTHDENYVRWTQWLFTRLLQAGLAYQAHAPVNWCEQDQTVLANEQVTDGRCERCGGTVTQRDMTQWFLKTTAYAEELHTGLDSLAATWPSKVIGAQRAWIGREEGARVTFAVDGYSPIDVFTSRPDLLSQAAALALAPEHPAASTLVTPSQRDALKAYTASARTLNDIERLSTARERHGIRLGVNAVNPLTGEAVPVIVCDSVLGGVGAAVLVPGANERDAALLQKMNLVVTAARAGRGAMDERRQAAQVEEALRILDARGTGRRAVNYRLRDWLVSRQRFWGAPVPVIHCTACGPQPVPDDQLPVTLPDLRGAQLRPQGTSPLGAATEWLATTCPACAGPARRDSDTLDTFVDSAWYFLRYLSPNDTERPFSSDLAQKWGPVDLYVGGDEHAVLHLLYARFITRALRDLGHLTWDEPFTAYLAQGKVLSGGHKMSKSRGNGVQLASQLDTHGVDAVRVALLFAGPVAENVEWTAVSPAASARFLRRALRLTEQVHCAPGTPSSGSSPLRQATAMTLRQVVQTIENHRYNVAIARLMSLVNTIYATAALPDTTQADVREAVEATAQVLSLFAPFTAEEMWSRLGHSPGIARRDWPHLENADQPDEVTAIVQVNGKVRARLSVPVAITAADLQAAALADPDVAAALAGQPALKVVVREPKVVSLRV